MRVTPRHEQVDAPWARRWAAIPAHKAAQNHKLNLTRRERETLLADAGFAVQKTYAAQNYPFFYKFPVLRARGQSRFDESRGRRDGYRLNLAGRLLQDGLYALAPYQMCNETVCLARKESAG